MRDWTGSNFAAFKAGKIETIIVINIENKEIKNIEDGLISDVIGGYKVSDIEVVAAYDINSSKVGKDLSQAKFEQPNNTLKFYDVPET